MCTITWKRKRQLASPARKPSTNTEDTSKLKTRCNTIPNLLCRGYLSLNWSVNTPRFWAAANLYKVKLRHNSSSMTNAIKQWWMTKAWRNQRSDYNFNNKKHQLRKTHWPKSTTQSRRPKTTTWKVSRLFPAAYPSSHGIAAHPPTLQWWTRQRRAWRNKLRRIRVARVSPNILNHWASRT